MNWEYRPNCTRQAKHTSISLCSDRVRTVACRTDRLDHRNRYTNNRRTLIHVEWPYRLQLEPNQLQAIVYCLDLEWNKATNNFEDTFLLKMWTHTISRLMTNLELILIGLRSLDPFEMSIRLLEQFSLFASLCIHHWFCLYIVRIHHLFTNQMNRSTCRKTRNSFIPT